MQQEQDNYEKSRERAEKARSRTRVDNKGVHDFQWRTGQWFWMPVHEERTVHLWNPQGGAALVGFHRTTYWLSMGWSTLTVLDGGQHG